MNSTSGIDILNTCFMVALAFTILFFIISVVLFFVFDIRTILSIKTGRAQQKTISEMKKANASTGRLRVDGKTMTSKLSEEDKKKARTPAVVPPPTSPSAPKQVEYNSGDAQTDALRPQPEEYNSGEAQTDVLRPQPAEYSSGEAQTDVLRPAGSSVQETYEPAEAETSVLGITDDISDGGNSVKADDINFNIVKRVVIIHTDVTIG